MSFCGTTVPMGYVCGVCTRPAERGKGLMTRLMQEAMRVMCERRYALTALIPASAWLFDYYARFGYVPAFDYALEKHFAAPETRTDACRIIPCQNLSLDACYAYFDRKQRMHACAVLHAAYDWETIVKDCQTDGGNAWVALHRDKLVGMAFAIPDNDNTLYIKELFYDYAPAKQALIQYLLARFRRATALVRISPAPTDARPYGMACILDKPRMIECYLAAYPDMDSAWLDRQDAGTLTQTLLHCHRREAWMNLMLD
jgi:predicted acetyltransferase